MPSSTVTVPKPTTKKPPHPPPQRTPVDQQCSALSVPLLPSRSLLLGASGFVRLRLAVAHITSEYVPLPDPGPVRLGSVTVHGARFPVVWRGDDPVQGAWVPLLCALTGGGNGFGRGRLGLYWGDVGTAEGLRLWAWMNYGDGTRSVWDPAACLSNWGTVTSGVPPEDLVDPVALTTVLHPLFIRMQAQEPLVRATQLPSLVEMESFDAMAFHRELAVAFAAVPPPFRKRTTALATLPRQRMPIRFAGRGSMTSSSVRTIIRDALGSTDPEPWVLEVLKEVTAGLQATCEMFWNCVATCPAMRVPRRVDAAQPLVDQILDMVIAFTVTTLSTMAPGVLVRGSDGDVHAADHGADVAVVAQAAVVASSMTMRPLEQRCRKERGHAHWEAMRATKRAMAQRGTSLLDEADLLQPRDQAGTGTGGVSTPPPAGSTAASPATGSAPAPASVPPPPGTAPHTLRTAAADRMQTLLQAVH